MTPPDQLPATLKPGPLATATGRRLVPALIADAGEPAEALHRILHRQYPQPAHAPCLRAGL